MNNQKNRTLCIVLHYGDSATTWECVRSISIYDELDIGVVDNDPIQSIQVPKDLLNRVRLMRTGGEAGFAEANNIGVKYFINPSHKEIMLLNNDIFFLDDSFRKLYHLLSVANIGAVGPSIRYATNKSDVWACGGKINKFRLLIGGLKEEGQGKPFEVDYLPGAAILCKKNVWEAVNGLPESYFLAYEEAEFALRVKSLGFKLLVDPKTLMYHHVGMSSDPQPMYIYNSVRNRIRFAKYLFGTFFGFFYGVLNTTNTFVAGNRKIKIRVKFKLWLRGVLDELFGKSLDRAILQKIKSKFKEDHD